MGKRYRILKVGNDAQQARSRASLRGMGDDARDPRLRSGTLERAPGRGYRVWDAATGEPRDLRLDAYTLVPAWYVAEAELGVAAGETDSGSDQLRPEEFLLRRITWASAGCGLAMDKVTCVATSGQTITNTVCPGVPLTAECLGRSVRVSFSDEFTKFLGKNSIIMAALFGDANGFLDMTREMLFAGKQTLSVDFERIFTLPGVTAEQTELIQVVFHGVGLLPLGENQSGSL